MKNRKIGSILSMLIFILIALPSCKTNPGVDPNLTADFTAEISFRFMVVWPPNTPLPTGIDYTMSIKLSETAGADAVILDVTAKFIDAESRSMFYSYPGSLLFATNQIQGNQTLFSNPYVQNIPFANLNAVHDVEMTITLQDVNNHIVSKDFSVTIDWGN